MDKFLQYIKEPHAWPVIHFACKMVQESSILQKNVTV